MSHTFRASSFPHHLRTTYLGVATAAQVSCQDLTLRLLWRRSGDVCL
jgi:hypothetical protein